VLQNGIHLGDLCSPQVVGHEQIVYREPAAEYVATHDEVQLPPEINGAIREVHYRYFSSG
jgi:hypothetical protein